ncbi:hypothetical protein CBM2608_A50035 [Cupriavidus taiwanensis]|uniref:hypothetical protein n=1 Tax=Cupriavidus taiwanensis TaxID=164546 RepID=UPI000E1AFA5C|nr:hypothetical protein [Cupriavidus taiwanensis]SOZ24691.1 hypothetical protein CBM2608_A50035 [Cupriavidus taiwanensis]
MNDYFHEVDTLSYQHQVRLASNELAFRVGELVDVSKAAIVAFQQQVRQRGEVTDEKYGRVLQYRFTSLIALAQTFKDVLGRAIEGFDWDSIVADVEHAATVQSMRNAIVHDSYPMLSLYSDGRYYFAVSVRRQGQGKKTVDIEVPAHDVETFSLEYVRSLSARLSNYLRQLPESIKLKGPQFDYDWFANAVKHPVILRFGVTLPSREEYGKLDLKNPPPLETAADILDSLVSFCTARLEELSKLPEMPFP